MTASDATPAPLAGDAASQSFFIHFAQPAILCVLGISILLVSIGLIKWVYRNVLGDPSRSGGPQVRLNAETRGRGRRRKR